MTGPGLDGPAVTVQRAGDLLNCSPRQVYRLLRAKQLESAPRFGRRATVTLDSVLALLDAPPAAKPRGRRSRSAWAAEQAEKIRRIPTRHLDG